RAEDTWDDERSDVVCRTDRHLPDAGTLDDHSISDHDWCRCRDNIQSRNDVFRTAYKYRRGVGTAVRDGAVGRIHTGGDGAFITRDHCRVYRHMEPAADNPDCWFIHDCLFRLLCRQQPYNI